MGKQEDQLKIANLMDEVIATLESYDLDKENNPEALHSHLDKVVELEILVNGFIERHGNNQWSNWGPAKFTKVRTLALPLESKLRQIDREEISSSKSFSRNMAIVSAVFAAVSAIAALYNMFFGSGS